MILYREQGDKKLVLREEHMILAIVTLFFGLASSLYNQPS